MLVLPQYLYRATVCFTTEIDLFPLFIIENHFVNNVNNVNNQFVRFDKSCSHFFLTVSMWLKNRMHPQNAYLWEHLEKEPVEYPEKNWEQDHVANLQALLVAESRAFEESRRR